MVLIPVLTGCDGSGDPTPGGSTYQPGIITDDKYAANYQNLFDGKSVLNIEVTLADAYYSEMLAQPEAEQFYSADVKLGTDTVTKVGFRTSGNTDLTEFAESAQQRYSYKIKFDKYVDKQKYLKLDEMYLLNLKNDPSYMRAFIAFAAFRAIGGSAPLCTYATLTINGQAQGLYLAVESIDDAFLKRVIGNNDGNLYKAAEGADLLASSSLALYDQKNGDDITKTDITNLMQILNDMPYGSKGDIESILDVDSALRYIAVCTGLGIYKSYLAKNPDNYYLAVNEDGKFVIIPWKTNSAFGAASKDNGVTVDISPYEPVYRASTEERPLVYKLLAVDEYVTRYEGYVTAVREYLENIGSVIDTVHALIGDKVQNDATAFYPYAQYLIAIGKGEASENSTGIISMYEYAQLRLTKLKSLNF